MSSTADTISPTAVNKHIENSEILHPTRVPQSAMVCSTSGWLPPTTLARSASLPVVLGVTTSSGPQWPRQGAVDWRKQPLQERGSVSRRCHRPMLFRYFKACAGCSRVSYDDTVGSSSGPAAARVLVRPCSLSHTFSYPRRTNPAWERFNRRHLDHSVVGVETSSILA